MIIGFLIIITVLVLWGILVRRRLAEMLENIDRTMDQIGIQLSLCFDALATLLNLTKEYAAHECQILIETIGSHRSAITAASNPKDIQKQEKIIFDILEHVSLISKQHPELKAEENYTKCLNAITNYENKIHTSRLIYNDSVTKFNRRLRMFPTSLLAGIIGFRKREYLEAAETEMSDIK